MKKTETKKLRIKANTLKHLSESMLAPVHGGTQWTGACGYTQSCGNSCWCSLHGGCGGGGG